MNENKFSYEAIEKKVGLKKAAIGQWFNKETNAIHSTNWVNLYPHIAPYLPPDFIHGEVMLDFPCTNIRDPETVLLLDKWKGIDKRSRLRTIDLLTQWMELDSRDQLKTLNFIAQLEEEKTIHRYASLIRRMAWDKPHFQVFP